MQTAARFLSFVMTAFLALPCASAAAETLRLDPVGLRYEAGQDERCLTRDTLDASSRELLGLDAATALAAMERDQSQLMVFSEDRQLSLCVLALPSDITAGDISELDEAGRQALLALMMREHAAQRGDWCAEMPDYALLEASSFGHMDMHTIFLDTLYLGKLYCCKLDVLGRELTEADRSFVLDVGARLLRLGAASDVEGAGQPLSLPQLPVLSTQNVVPTADNSDVPVTVEPIPTVIGANAVILSGTTDPAARLRLKINGNTSSAFEPEPDGSYSVTAKGLNNGEVTSWASLPSTARSTPR